jgi:DNA invertase Pin-like site-specific DNA recombinase
LAVVYVRQSSPQQVRENRESTSLQYGLVERAAHLGWHRDRVLVIDEDQAQTGSTAENRMGFQRLMAEVGLDHVGLVLGIEMSRIARSNKDWHQLLELCGLFRTLLADQDGLYEPTDFNDRLLLGLKGTMSEAELHILRSRMENGRRNKARRGELFSFVPTGYVLMPSGEVVMEPDEQARCVVHLIFEKFEELQTIAGVVRYLNKHGILLGVRPTSGPQRGRLEWRRPSHVTIRNMLRHPMYAGTYCWGRFATDPRRKVAGKPKSGRRLVPRDEWVAFLKDRLPAYITWQQHEQNLGQMERNQTRQQGVPREGTSLLSGLVYCGRCGRRMRVITGKPEHPRYHCLLEGEDFPPPTCQGVQGTVLDEFISRQALQVLEPASLDLSIQAAEDIQRERARIHQHWKQQLERAKYGRERTERQYQAAEPENRLVTRELESQWEKALREERQLQEEYKRFQREEPEMLREEDRERVMSLVSDIPALWRDTSTTVMDRQTIIRHLIERIEINVQGKSEYVDVKVHWAGGYESHSQLLRPVGHFDQLRDSKQLFQRILQLREEGMASPQIALQLNEEGFRTARRSLWQDYHVRRLLRQRGIVRYRLPDAMTDQLGEDEWWIRDLARELEVPRSTVTAWTKRGWISGRQLPGKKGRWILWADAQELQRLRRLRACPRSWNDEPFPSELTTPQRRSEP